MSKPYYITRDDCLGLTEEELKFLRDGDAESAFGFVLRGRCSECGHLCVLHNDHCCSFCMIPGCSCEKGPEVDYDEPEKDTH